MADLDLPAGARSTGKNSAQTNIEPVGAKDDQTAQQAVKVAAATFKYRKSDLQPLTVSSIHYDYHAKVYADHTDIDLHFSATTLDRAITTLVLNAKGLDVHSVACEHEMKWEYDRAKDQILITFKNEIPAKSQFTVHTTTTCRPDGKTLEGIYYDATPEGAPTQQITQCQQWGFQRIMPCIDDMRAKATYIGKIEADARYTHIITNGDLISQQDIGHGRRLVEYHNTKTPMSPYLFFLGVGTWHTERRFLEYPDGQKINLEILTLENNPQGSKEAIDILHDVIMWTHLFSGPQRYEQLDTRYKIWELIKQRNDLQAQAENQQALSELKAEIQRLAEGLTLGYKYTGETYREIAMRLSNFGGMENVGNTTLLASLITRHPDMLDERFEKFFTIKPHEYYHNLNGSEVTSENPFYLWLNEGVAKYHEREAVAFFMGRDYELLSRAIALIEHKIDSGSAALHKDIPGIALPIEVEAFNSSLELISPITYTKGHAFVRMVENLIGEHAFAKGLDLYHTRHKHGCATREDWISAMEEASGANLQRMADVWLTQVGHPHLHVETIYEQDKKTFRINLQQAGYQEGKHWEFPFSIALVDKSGKDLWAGNLHVTQATQEFTIEGIDQEPAFVSLNRGYNLFGKVFYSQASDKQLRQQALLDTDMVGRFLAFRELADREKIRLLQDSSADVSKRFVDLYYSMISNKNLCDKVGNMMLEVWGGFLGPEKMHMHQEHYEVSQKIKLAIAKKYEAQLFNIYGEREQAVFEHRSSIEKACAEIRNRQVKDSCLSLLACLDTKDIRTLLRDKFDLATNYSDKMTVYSAFVQTDAPQDQKVAITRALLNSAESDMAWENALYTLGQNDSAIAPELISLAINSERFDWSKPFHSGIARMFASHARTSLLSESGRELLSQMIIKSAAINPGQTDRLVKAIGKLDVYKPEDQVSLVEMVRDTLQGLDAQNQDTLVVYNGLQQILTSSPNAVENHARIFAV